MKCSFGDCEKPAIATYVWEWGEHGLCCADHSVVCQQKAAQLKRRVVISPLQPGEPTPITRDERIAARALEMALKEENAELQNRGMELYRANEQLKQQVQTERSLRLAIEAECETLRSRMVELQTAVGEARDQAARENAELQQLRALVPAAAPVDPTPAA